MLILKTTEKRVNKIKKNILLSIGIVVLILFLDQLLKFWVKTNMVLGETIPILGNWFNLYFVENEGMAFGISFGQNIGKLLLSLLRVVLVVGLCMYLYKLIKREKIDALTLVTFSLIIAGAFGNIIDGLFYGLIFNESTMFSTATLFSAEGGYAPFFYGRVVDMFYVRLFPIPEGFPIWGGSYFFPAIFNIADACITVGVAIMIIFNKRIFRELEKKDTENSSFLKEEASV